MSRFLAAMPNISIPRSRFPMTFNHATSLMHGKLVPIDCFEVIAGDTFHLDLSALVWMSTPIAPIFGNIKMYFKAFFVPMRLVWEHWEEFFGANKTSAGYQTTKYTIPQHSVYYNNVTAHSIGHYLGLPITAYDATKAAAGYGMASVLKERGYLLIWNEHYRAQQVQNPCIVTLDDTDGIGTKPDNTTFYIGSDPLNVNKEFDYFTACTTAPQYGPAVTLPLGTYAPVVTRNVDAMPYDSDWDQGDDGDKYRYMKLAFPGNGQALTGNSTRPTLFGAGTVGDLQSFTTTGGMADLIDDWNASMNKSGVIPQNLWADLSTATSATINTLRYAFAVQKYLERSNFGSRYYEILSVHYGVTSPDSRLQIPERLGSCELDINVNTVLSTADATTTSSTKLGQPGAVSCNALRKKSLFTKAFVEPGYVFILCSTHHMRSYTQGLNREDTKKERYDFYSPEFANLGDQAVLKKEIYLAGASSDEDVFGYQEHWAEYRYRPDRVSGLLDPSVSGGLDYWTLAEKFASVPSLSSTFIQENRDLLARALVTGATGPDYIADFHFDYTATREMPIRTIPGLIDHFGSF